MGVQQTALWLPPHQGQKFLLPVYVDEQLTQFANRTQRQELAIHPGSRTPFQADDTAQEQFVFGGDGLCFQPFSDTGETARVEGGGDLRTLCAVPYHVRRGATADGQHDGVDQDGLAGAGLAGQGSQTRPQVEIDGVDDGEVANGEMSEHGSVVVAVSPGSHPGRWSARRVPSEAWSAGHGNSRIPADAAAPVWRWTARR